MIVDVRMRPPIAPFADIHATARKMAAAAVAAGQPDLASCASLASGSLDDCLAEMRELGIERALVPARVRAAADGPAHNAGLADFVHDRERFIGFGSPDLDSADPVADLEQLTRSLGLKGIALEPGHWTHPIRGDDRALFPIYDWCQATETPVVLMAGGNAGPDITYSAPAIVDRIAVEFPRLVLIVTHGGWPWVVPAVSVAIRRPNVYLAPDMYLFGMPGCQDFVEAGNGRLRDKLLFASGYPFVSLKAAVDWTRRHFEPDVLPAILGENAARALRLPS